MTPESESVFQFFLSSELTKHYPSAGGLSVCPYCILSFSHLAGHDPKNPPGLAYVARSTTVAIISLWFTM